MIPPGAKVLRIAELTHAIKGVLEDGFTNLWVAGEISEYKRHGSGHVYLTLKDELAQIRCVVWRSVAPRLRFEPRVGVAIVARGRLDVYLPHGEYKLVIEQMLPHGDGAFELAFRQLKERLFAAGYFDPARKRPLPSLPRRVALVTSPTGAAIRDMIEVLARRWPAVQVIVVPVRVQGDGAAEEISSAIAMLNRLNAAGRLVTDVMIVGRGGGSLEDLWAFNEEVVAKAIFGSRIPVVSAVGHETDVTIADLVADHRALTPTHAATDIVPDRQAFLAVIQDRQSRLHGAARRLVDRSRQRLEDLSSRRAFRLPLDRIRDRERRLDEWGDRLKRAGQGAIRQAAERMSATSARLEALSPLSTLGRGYSLTQTTDGLVVRDAARLHVGDSVQTRLNRGRIVCRVEEVVHE